MKTYTITVNGNVYDVTVEENDGTGVSTPVAAPKAAPKAAAPKKTAPSGAQGSVKANAPMPGKILAVKANVGDSVKKGDVLFILEAMKMENEIGAPSDGTIASINVAVGDNVEAGAVLATLN